MTEKPPKRATSTSTRRQGEMVRLSLLLRPGTVHTRGRRQQARRQQAVALRDRRSDHGARAQSLGRSDDGTEDADGAAGFESAVPVAHDRPRRGG
jgi:hypothetical protein